MTRTVQLHNFTCVVLIPEAESEPRNMGADLIVLTDGRLLMGFSRWLSGAHYNDASEVVGIVSDDSGETWSEPFDIVKPDATVNAV